MDMNLILIFVISALNFIALIIHKKIKRGVLINQERDCAVYYMRTVLFLCQIIIPLLAVITICYPHQSLQYFNITEPLQYFCVFFGLFAFGLLLWAVCELGVSGNEVSSKAIILSGPYQFIRHPIYAAYITMLLVISFVAGSFICIILSLIVKFFYCIIVANEERYLIHKYPKYFKYMTTTGRFLPKFSLLPQLLDSRILIDEKYEEFLKNFSERSGYEFEISYLNQGFARAFFIGNKMVAGYVTNSKPDLRYCLWVPLSIRTNLMKNLTGPSSEITCIWIDRKITHLQRAYVYWMSIVDARLHNTNRIFGGSFSKTAAIQQQKSMPKLLYSGPSSCLNETKHCWIYYTPQFGSLIMLIKVILFQLIKVYAKKKKRNWKR